jgi:Tol biopolymer transport system component
MRDAMDPVERDLAAWLSDGPELGPADGLTLILTRTRTVRQRPAWRVRGWWSASARMGSPWSPPIVAALLLLAGLVLLLVAFVLVSGSHPRPPKPFGPAGNGRLVYDTGPGGGVFVASPDGTNPVPIAAEGIERAPAYSPDGTTIAFWSRPRDDPHQTSARLPVTFALYLADADGSHVRRIAAGQRFSINALYPVAWAPDSARVAFAADDGSGDDVWTAGADGSRPLRLTNEDLSAFGPAWSPDGRWMVFTEDSETLHRIVLIHADGDDRVVLHEQRVIGSLEQDAAFGGALAWAPDSQRFVYSRGRDLAAPSEQPYAMYLVVATVSGDEKTIAVDPGGGLIFPTWSPDGSRIAYLKGSSPAEAHVVDPENPANDQVVGRCFVGDGGLNAFGWAPDGRWIVFGCPDQPELRPIDPSGPATPKPIPQDALALDIQRVAP